MRRTHHAGVVVLVLAVACGPAPKPAPEVAATATPLDAGPASSPPPPTRDAAASEPPPPFIDAKEADASSFLHPPGPREPLKRYDHAVVLYARTQTVSGASGKHEREETRLVPL